MHRQRLRPDGGRLHRHEQPRRRGRERRFHRRAALFRGGIPRCDRRHGQHERRRAAEDRSRGPADRHDRRFRPDRGRRDRGGHRQPAGRADLHDDRGLHQRARPRDHPRPHAHQHAADRRRHQRGQLRRSAVRYGRQRHRHDDGQGLRHDGIRRVHRGARLRHPDQRRHARGLRPAALRPGPGPRLSRRDAAGSRQ